MKFWAILLVIGVFGMVRKSKVFEEALRSLIFIEIAHNSLP